MDPKLYLIYKDDLVAKVSAIREKGRNGWSSYQSAEESRKLQHESCFPKGNHISTRDGYISLEKSHIPSGRLVSPRRGYYSLRQSFPKPIHPRKNDGSRIRNTSLRQHKGEEIIQRTSRRSKGEVSAYLIGKELLMADLGNFSKRQSFASTRKVIFSREFKL